MKVIYSITISSLLLFITVLFSSNADAVVCQNKTAIVFSNGMFNDISDADLSRRKLKGAIKSKLAGTPLLQELEMNHLAFASDGSQFVPQVGGTGTISKLINAALALPNAAGQVAEVVWQKMVQDSFSAFWRWRAGLLPAGSRLQKIYETIAAGTNSASYIYDPDLQRHVAMYKTLLNSGKRVLIVSHSQGNFYANASYHYCPV